MKKIFVVSLVAFSALALSGCALLYPNWGTDQNPSTSQSATPSESASASPSPSTSAIPSKKVAAMNVIMVDTDLSSQTVYVVGEATNVFEDNGSCTITLEQGSLTKSMKVKAESNVNTTQCFPANVSYEGFVKGAAKVYVSYSSDAFDGVSKPTTVNIP